MNTNTYTKFCPNVFVAKCPQEHQRGDLINITTKHGKEVENEVHNFLGKTRDGFFLYSVTRMDGYNAQERARRKAERLQQWASNANERSARYYEASQEGKAFLSLAEPIKVGHHSEKRHRALIERNWQRMGKSVAEAEKAERLAERASYWAKKENDVNLSMPESIEFYEFKLEEAKEKHKFLKDNPDKRPHSMALQYANKAVKDAEANLKLALRLWGTPEQVEQVESTEGAKAQSKSEKQAQADAVIDKYGGFFAFNSEQFKEGYNALISKGLASEGDKVTHIVGGLYIPTAKVDAFLSEFKEAKQ